MDRDALVTQIVSRGRDENGHIRHEAVFELRGLKVPVAKIAELFKVSRNAIYKILKGRPELLAQKYKNDIMRLTPWRDVELEHAKAAQRAYVAHHIEYMLTGGKELDGYKLSRLRTFYLGFGDPQDTVLTYDRNEPSNQWASAGGWKYVPREESDGDLLFRTDDELSEEQKRVYVRPDNWQSIK